MTNEQQAFATTARELATLLQTTCAAMGLNAHATSALLCAAIGHALTEASGPVIAAERLRKTANKIEQTMLLQVGGTAQ